MPIKVRYVRRNRFGNFSKSGRYYAIRGELHKLPQYRLKAPAPNSRRRVQPPRAPAPEPRRATTTALVEKAAGSEFRRGAKYSTWFKAAGSVEKDRRMTFADSYAQGLMDEDVESEEEGYAIPALFFSNQGGLLGQVKFDGIIPLETLIGRLNLKLQFLGEESPDFDFRIAYPRWEYKYQIIETLGPTSRIIKSQSDRRPR